jgi:hypothetical protein
MRMADYDEADDEVLLDLGDLGDDHTATIRRYNGGAPKVAVLVTGKKRSYPAKRLPIAVALALATAIRKHEKAIRNLPGADHV